jgi:cell division protein FtsQ
LAISISLRTEALGRRARVRAVAVVAVLAVLVAFGAALLSRSALFAVRSIDVSGVAHLSAAQVVDRAHIQEGANVLWLDEAEVERRLEEHPWIGDAHVSVALPATIRIAVVERVPVAVASGRLGYLYVAADGTALGHADRAAGLPRIPTGMTAAARRTAAAALGAMSPGLRAIVSAVRVRADGSITLDLRDGPGVEYGSAERLAAKALAVERILDWADATGEELVRVDVVAPGAPAVQLAA